MIELNSLTCFEQIPMDIQIGNNLLGLPRKRVVSKSHQHAKDYQISTIHYKGGYHRK